MQRIDIKIKCEICGLIFITKPCYIKRATVKFCSRKCYYISRKGKPTWITGRHHTKESKIKIGNASRTDRVCDLEGCNNKHRSNGFCRKHDPRQFKRKMNVKLDVFEHYCGGFIKCMCCGERNLCFLTIDHIKPIKKAKNRGDEGGGSIFYKLRRENYPDGYQILCFNCNLAKGINKECPHKTYGANV